MATEIQAGITDVQFRIGRGYAVGRAVNVDDKMVDIRTQEGHIIRRKKSAVTVVVKTETVQAEAPVA